MTVEEFATSTGRFEGKEELIDGRVHRSPPPSFQHGETCVNIGCILNRYELSINEGAATIGSGLIVARNPDSVLSPDVQFFSPRRLPDNYDGWPNNPPTLAVEILDSSREYGVVMTKVDAADKSRFCHNILFLLILRHI